MRISSHYPNFIKLYKTKGQGGGIIKNKLLLVGGGGHCKSVLDTLLEQNTYTDIAIADDNIEPQTRVMGVPVIGNCDDLHQYFLSGFEQAFITIGSIGNPQLRVDIFTRLVDMGFHIPNIFDKTSTVSGFASLGRGIFAGKNSVINAAAQVGDGAIINTSVIVEHDCFVGAFAHISSGTVLCGNVHIGERTHIGANSVIKQGLMIGADAMIGMGSVVSLNLPEKIVAFGNPCKIVRSV